MFSARLWAVLLPAIATAIATAVVEIAIAIAIVNVAAMSVVYALRSRNHSFLRRLRL
jgi:hypothetical protein